MLVLRTLQQQNKNSNIRNVYYAVRSVGYVSCIYIYFLMVVYRTVPFLSERVSCMYNNNKQQATQCIILHLRSVPFLQNVHLVVVTCIKI